MIELLVGLIVGAAIVLILTVKFMDHQRVENAQLWKHIAELESDKRALMESLARTQGKPFIPAGKQALVPSEGWWDAADIVRTPQ